MTTIDEPDYSEHIEKALSDAKEQGYTAVVVIGMHNDRKIGIHSSSNNIGMLHWMMNRGQFELNLTDRNSVEQSE